MADASERDSAEYWKKQAKHYEQKVLDIQQELDEYTENSAQLEKELEASLVQVEKQNRDLDNQNQRLKAEIEMLKSKLERSQHESNALEDEIQTLKLDKDKQAIYIRELEQKNDDLERGQRVISESVSYIEALLNQAYERNAVLESEVDEVEALRVRLQRATDEARDLKQELKVVERLPHEKKEENDNAPLANGHAETEPQTPATPLKREMNGNTMTPSSRVSAINIVGDLLRKVGLERFLCTDCGKVRCACRLPPAAEPPAPADPPTSCVNYHYKGHESREESTDEIEYRRPRQHHRQTSDDTATNNNGSAKRSAEPGAGSPELGAQRAGLRPNGSERAPSPELGAGRLESGSKRSELGARTPELGAQRAGLRPNGSERARCPELGAGRLESGSRRSELGAGGPEPGARSSEQPFARGGELGGGKLRRSFVVRSREGLSSLFGLTPTRKDVDKPARPKLSSQSSNS